jgi:hypothetical protein
MRLIRTLLVISGAGFFMPSPPDDIAAGNVTAKTQDVSPLEMLSTASSAVTDVAGFCSRQQGFCDTAAYVAGRLEVKAKYSVKLLYEWAADSTSDPALATRSQEAVKVDMLKTGTTLAGGAVPETKGQSTLKLEDVIPEWRGLAKKKPQVQHNQG